MTYDNLFKIALLTPVAILFFLFFRLISHQPNNIYNSPSNEAVLIDGEACTVNTTDDRTADQIWTDMTWCMRTIKMTRRDRGLPQEQMACAISVQRCTLLFFQTWQLIDLETEDWRPPLGGSLNKKSPLGEEITWIIHTVIYLGYSTRIQKIYTETKKTLEQTNG